MSARQGEGLTKPELTAGLLQHTLQEVAQHAGMAGLLCETAGWPYLAMLCNALSKQAAAGGRYELLPLLEVSTTDWTGQYSNERSDRWKHTCTACTHACKLTHHGFHHLSMDMLCQLKAGHCTSNKDSVEVEQLSRVASMQVDGLDACRARALHRAGLRTPLAVLQASEQQLKEALADALPRGMQRHAGLNVRDGTLAAAQACGHCVTLRASCVHAGTCTHSAMPAQSVQCCGCKLCVACRSTWPHMYCACMQVSVHACKRVLLCRWALA